MHGNTRLEAKFAEFSRTQNELVVSVQALHLGHCQENTTGEDTSEIDRMFPI